MKQLINMYKVIVAALVSLLMPVAAMAAAPTIDLTGVDTSWATTEGLKVGALCLGVVIAFFVIRRIVFLPSK